MKLKLQINPETHRGRKPNFPDLLEKYAELPKDEWLKVKPPKFVETRKAKITKPETILHMMQLKVGQTLRHFFGEQLTKKKLRVATKTENGFLYVAKVSA